MYSVEVKRLQSETIMMIGFAAALAIASMSSGLLLIRDHGAGLPGFGLVLLESVSM